MQIMSLCARMDQVRNTCECKGKHGLCVLPASSDKVQYLALYHCEGGDLDNSTWNKPFHPISLQCLKQKTFSVNPFWSFYTYCLSYKRINLSDKVSFTFQVFTRFVLFQCPAFFPTSTPLSICSVLHSRVGSLACHVTWHFHWAKVRAAGQWTSHKCRTLMYSDWWDADCLQDISLWTLA